MNFPSINVWKKWQTTLTATITVKTYIDDIPHTETETLEFLGAITFPNNISLLNNEGIYTQYTAHCTTEQILSIGDKISYNGKNYQIMDITPLGKIQKYSLNEVYV
jgi:hypothetical protein